MKFCKMHSTIALSLLNAETNLLEGDRNNITDCSSVIQTTNNNNWSIVQPDDTKNIKHGTYCTACLNMN
jgi:hypothetical protein